MNREVACPCGSPVYIYGPHPHLCMLCGDTEVYEAAKRLGVDVPRSGDDEPRSRWIGKGEGRL